MHNFHSSILRKYDIRGIYEETLKDDDAFFLGKSICKYLEKTNPTKVVICCDGRISSPSLKNSLIQGLEESGLEVIDVGIGPSPMLYFAIYHLDCDFGIMVTGSHNPANYNGFKISLKDGKPFYDQDIKNLSGVAKKGDFVKKMGIIREFNIKDIYVARIIQDSDLAVESKFLDEVDDLANENKFKIAWDAGNGSAGEIMKKITKKIRAKHFLLYENIDGNFPNHHPDPTVEENLSDLKQLVIKQQCNLGIAFDGDGDRIGIVDDEGEVIWSDQFMILFAQEILEQNPKATIISDVKASNIFFNAVKEMGGNPIIWKTGHSYIKDKIKETKALLAGEMSGHIFFCDKYYGFDDALYAAIRLINIVHKKSILLSDFRKSLPKSLFTTEIKIKCSDQKKFNIVNKIKDKLTKSGDKFIDIDGIRVEGNGFWWLIRASNTQPCLVIRCEANSKDLLEEIKEKVDSILKTVNLSLTPKAF
jgi:phosphomannomutase